MQSKGDNRMSVNEKVVVITGGTSGIGEATVRLFAENGARVTFVGTNKSKGDAVMEKLKAAGFGETVCFFQGDVSKAEDVAALAEFTQKKFGPCDILFNNAGVHFAGKLHETPVEEFDRVISVDLRGVYLCCYHYLPQMLAKKKGCIVNMSSVSGVCADFSMAAYNAAKGGVSNLTRAIAIDYADEGIRANAVCPGAVRTEMLEYTFRKIPYAEEVNRKAYPTHTFATPEEIAELVLFIASDKVNFLNGTNILVDGGITAHTGQPKY
jgi:meso-butanediol dehydrogenase/(S,S)-butanediol dehydrogenase/diacetyl reductase